MTAELIAGSSFELDLDDGCFPGGIQIDKEHHFKVCQANGTSDKKAHVKGRAV